MTSNPLNFCLYLLSFLQKIMDRGMDSVSPRTRVESFSKVNSQGSSGSSFVPEVLSEPQFNGPAHLMETIATSLEGQNKYVVYVRFISQLSKLHFILSITLNGDSVVRRASSSSSRSSNAAPEQVYSYQKYDEHEDP